MAGYTINYFVGGRFHYYEYETSLNIHWTFESAKAKRFTNVNEAYDTAKRLSAVSRHRCKVSQS